ncbi:SDR family NAD(P)-dependent oxidoreductase [Magnetospirillum gryphiswaldense]|uniref:Short-chain dehydrogenase/reductase SDR n=2 Tax=Magnetospirillum gryphiswaldense TaxID=55518 RepID=V6EYX0_MAGGM|nr:SDR family NAD(P)-dependent oxidoreductase [Magnetospirillum gryphiswaldense]AVM74480.1 Bile acid 7-dehydroxylase 1/3 [Magnetospirillum gryphiswaldense MSR-1]AVM78383.1 Bile acid 7-dehydroxylase 1/3 [Magnetospirillum gryphiswaldense]CAM75426.1 3-hydroxyacyl-CoA dehydrogenase type II [Magnetospirillum gryphiswaldense MSR-1]CDK97423.1 putative short-chain dehydrogenase/reductase SDR [Magnetospirillum gryphiswaldense MSR-1 v2]
MDIRNVAAIVTGGGSGLGAETARALAKQGAKVAVLDLNEANVQAVAAEIGGIGLVCDVTSAESVEAALAAAREAHGIARIAVNCAGVATPGKVVGRKGPLALDAFAKVIQINLIGTFNVMRLAAADMLGLEPLDTGERGVVVNTASIAAFDGQIGQVAYAASKGGVASLSLPAAREFAPAGIRVMAIAPGYFGTPMVNGMPQEVLDSLVASTLFPHRLGLPEEYARMVLSIIDNPMLNGSTIRLDGAVRMPAQ